MLVKHRRLWVTLFVLPCMVLFAFIYAIPMITVCVTSFTEYSVFQSPIFTGLDNFRTIFSDKSFLVSIRNTLLWVLFQTTFHVLLGLAVALVFRRRPRGWKFVRTAYLIPNIIPTAAVGVMFILLLNPSFGIVKDLIEHFGNGTQVPNFFGDSSYAFWTVTATWIFYSAFNTIIFSAVIGTIDKELFEAAAIDGASPWQIDRRITLPLIKNAIGTCVVLASVAMVSQFDIIYLTTKGGPGTATLNLPIYLYKTAILESNYGKANAVGVVQIIIGVSLVILIQRLFGMSMKSQQAEKEKLL